MKTETLGSLMVLFAFFIGGIALLLRARYDTETLGTYAGAGSVVLAIIGCIVSIAGKK